MADYLVSLGTRSAENNTISSVSGASAPWTVTLASAPSAGTQIGDVLTDEHATPRSYVITGISGNDLTVNDQLGVGSAPDNSGTSQATTARAYATVASFEAGGWAGAGVPDTITGECWDDGDFARAAWDLNDSTVDGLTITSSSSDRHTGVKNTGVTFTPLTAESLATNFDMGTGGSSNTRDTRFSWIEFNCAGAGYARMIGLEEADQGNFDHNLIYDYQCSRVGANPRLITSVSSAQANHWFVHNNIIWNTTYNASSANTLHAISLTGTIADDDVDILNNTIVDTVNTNVTSGSAYGILPRDRADHICKNNLVYGTASDSGGTAEDFDNTDGITNIDFDYNLSEDATADDWGVNNNVVNATITFENAGANDYRLASGDTDAIDAGVDLSASTAADIEVDILGVTRTGTWDIGAHFLSAVDPNDYGNLPSIGASTGRERLRRLRNRRFRYLAQDS